MPTETLPVRVRSAARQPPAPGVPYAGWWRALLFLLLISVPVVIITRLIAVYGVDVPYWDDWENAEFFTVSHYGHQSLLELARLQNECRSLFPNLIFLLLSLPGNWSVVREMYFEVALVAVVCAVLFQLLRRTGFSLPVQSGLLFVIGWMMFSLTQHENWFFGIQICYYLVPAALCFALLANVTHRSLGWKTLVSLAMAFLATYSFSGGVLVPALAFPGLLPANWSAAGGWRPKRRELAWHATYILGSVAMLMAYFWNYTQPGGRGSLVDLLLHAGAPLNYFFAWLGSPLFPREPVSHAIRTGMIVCAFLIALLAACWRGFLDREEQRRLYPWVILAGYAVGTGAITVVGRAGYGVQQALSSRYISFSLYAYVVVLVLGTYLWCFHRQRIASWARYTLLAAGLGVLGVAGVFFTRAQLASLPWIADNSHHRNFALQGLTFMPLMNTSQNLDTLCGVPEFVQLRAMDLIRRRVLDIPLASKTLRAAIQKVDPRGNSAFGELDEPTAEANGRVSIRGWAVNPAQRQPAGRVLITCTGKDGVTRPLLAYVTDLYRPLGAPATGIYQAMPCAFMGQASFDRLPPGEYLVAAWAVDLRLNMVNQLGYAWPYTWGRMGKLKRPLDSLVFPPVVATQNAHNGALEAVVPANNDTLDVRGWAVDVNSRTVPKAVLITCTDSAGVTRIVAQVGSREHRPDVVETLHIDALIYSGFKTRIDLGKLPPGDHLVAAWGVMADDDETLAQLGSTYPIHVLPK